jgi:hypothetical protein
MKTVWVYYETNHGELLGDCDACSDMRVLADKDHGKQLAESTIREYAGSGGDVSVNRFVVDGGDLANAGITLDAGSKLTDEQVHQLVDIMFRGNSGCVTLYQNKQGNCGSYFEIHLEEKKIERRKGEFNHGNMDDR